VRALYQQHTDETGQAFSEDARRLAYWEQKVFVREQQSQSGQTICVWGM